MKKNLLLLSMVLLFSSCESQLGSAISGIFSNLTSGDAVVDSSGDKAYNEMKKKYLEKPVNNSVSPTCNSLEGLVPINGSDSKNMSSIKDKLCTCVAWGSCDSKSCSCDNLCPSDFGIFKKMSQKDQEAEANTLAFTNTNNKFSDGLTYKGYCWGISLVTQRFNRMATFAPESNKKFQEPGQENARINEYKNIIARLNNNEAVTIPGFKNLFEFSSDPEVKSLIEDSVKEQWSQSAMTTQGLASVSDTTTPPASEMNKLFDDVEFKLKNNLSPALVYNPKDARTESHVLLASGSGVNPETKERYLCLRDNNFRALNSMDCNIKMILKKDGSVVRQFGDPKLINSRTKKPDPPIVLGKIALAHTDNSNTMEQMSNLHAKCAGEKDCPKKL